MYPISEGGSKKIVASTLAQFQTLAQFCNADREVAHADIGLLQRKDLFFQFPFVHAAYSRNLKSTSREVGYSLF